MARVLPFPALLSPLQSELVASDGQARGAKALVVYNDGADPTRGRHDIPAGGRWGSVHPFTPELPRLLLYDLEADRFATKDVNEQHPDLVAKYQALLEEHWKANQALGQRYLAASDTPVTPAQLEQLKSLGYVQ